MILHVHKEMTDKLNMADIVLLSFFIIFFLLFETQKHHLQYNYWHYLQYDKKTTIKKD